MRTEASVLGSTSPAMIKLGPSFSKEGKRAGLILILFNCFFRAFIDSSTLYLKSSQATMHTIPPTNTTAYIWATPV